MESTHTQIKQIIIILCIFLIIGSGIVWDSLSYPMFWDDLHLIRSFSYNDIISSFIGNWDPDNLETKGFRPLTLIFNHIRYNLFGENVEFHRLFLISLYAIYLTTICWLANIIFDLPWKLALIAGVLNISAKYNVFHYVFISDGIHLFQGCTFVFSLVFLIVWLTDDKIWKFILSIGLSICCLLIREEALALSFITIIFGYIFVIKNNNTEKIKRMHLYAIISIVAATLFFLYRSIVVSGASPLSFHPKGLLLNIGSSFFFLGLGHFNALSMVLIYGGVIGLAIFSLIYIFSKQFIVSKNFIILLSCIIISAAPGLVIYRANLLLFPITFASLLLCVMFNELNMSRITRYFIFVILIWTLVGSNYIRYIYALNFHPNSLYFLTHNRNVIYEEAGNATIPVQRLNASQKHLESFGIISQSDIERQWEDPSIIGRRYPTTKDEVFIPLLHLFEP